MEFTSDALAAKQVQNRLVELYKLIQMIEKKRQQSENGINMLTKMLEEKTQSHNPNKLLNMRKTALQQAEEEDELLRSALMKINEIRDIKNERRLKSRLSGIRKPYSMKMLHNYAQTLPLYIGKPGERPPPLCGAIPAESNYIAKVGDMVAAYAEIDGEQNWILAEVLSFNHATNKYEIDDIIQETNQKKRQIVNKKHVIPLPLMRANPETDPEALFPEGTIVLALYPRTSCVYPAIVSKMPATYADGYDVVFYDGTYEKGYSPPMQVAQRYVIAEKQKK